MRGRGEEGNGRDLRLGGAASLAVHAALGLVVGFSLAHARQPRLVPPELIPLRLDLDLPAGPAAEQAADAGNAPSAAATPVPAAPPRPHSAALIAPDGRLAPTLSQQVDLAPAAPLTLAPAAPAAGAGVPSVAAVAGPATGKHAFGTGFAPSTSAADLDAAGGGAGGAGTGVGIEGPISVRRAIRPLYPLGARQRGEEGRVVLDATVAADGRPLRVALLASSRSAELDAAARRAVERAWFNPATEDGRPVEAHARITIVFRLTD